MLDHAKESPEIRDPRQQPHSGAQGLAQQPVRLFMLQGQCHETIVAMTIEACMTAHWREPFCLHAIKVTYLRYQGKGGRYLCTN